MISNAYCKKHDEIEPEEGSRELWVCPQCSRESIKRLTKRLPNGKKPLDHALEVIEEQLNKRD